MKKDLSLQRNHMAFNILFNALAILFTGPLFHLAWFLIARPILNRKSGESVHLNWLMRFKKFRDVREKINGNEESNEADSVDTDDISGDPFSTATSSEAPQNESESALTPISSEPEDYFSYVANETTSHSISIETESEDDSILPPVEKIEVDQSWKKNKFLNFPYKDLRAIFFNIADDQTLITLSQPIDKATRGYALHELLFNRQSEAARQYRHGYFQFHLSHNTIPNQPFSADDFANMSTNFPNDHNLFLFTMTARLKLGYETLRLIKELISFQHYGSDREINTFCEVPLKGKLDAGLVFSLRFRPENFVGHKNLLVGHETLLAFGGDISKTPKKCHQQLIHQLVDYCSRCNDYRILRKLNIEKWSEKNQRHLIKSIFDRVNKYRYTHKDPFHHFNFDLLKEKILNGLLGQLITKLTESKNQRYHICLKTPSNAIGNFLRLSKNKDLVEKIYTNLSIKLDDVESENRHMILVALYSTNYENLSDKLKPKHLNLLMNKDSHTTKILQQLDFSKIDDKIENTIVDHVIDKNINTYLDINALNITTLSTKNQHKILSALIQLYSLAISEWLKNPPPGHFISMQEAEDHMSEQEIISDILDSIKTLLSKKLAPDLQTLIAKFALNNISSKHNEMYNRDIQGLGEVYKPNRNIQLLSQLDLSVLEPELEEKVKIALIEFTLNPNANGYYEIIMCFSFIQKLEAKSQLKFAKLFEELALERSRVGKERYMLEILKHIKLSLLPEVNRNALINWLHTFICSGKCEIQRIQKIGVDVLLRFDIALLNDEQENNHYNALFTDLLNYEGYYEGRNKARHNALATLLQLDINQWNKRNQENIMLQLLASNKTLPDKAEELNTATLADAFSQLFKKLKDNEVKNKIKDKLFEYLDNSHEKSFYFKMCAQIRSELTPEERKTINKNYVENNKENDPRLWLLPHFWYKLNDDQKAKIFPDANDKNEENSSDISYT